MRAIRAARAVTCIALASALSVPAFAASFDYYLKLPPIEGDSDAADDEHKGQIEILSWSWGASQPAAAHGAGMGAGKVQMRDISLAPAPTAKKSTPSVSEIVVTKSTDTASPAMAGNANDRLRTAGPKDGWPSAAAGEAEITLKGKAAEAKKLPGQRKYGDITLKRGTTAGAEAPPARTGGTAGSFAFGVEREMKESGEKGGTEDINIGVGELQEATISKSMEKSSPKLLEAAVKGKVFAAPLPQGALWVKTKAPWPGCKLGARYPSIELGDGVKTYKLTDLTVASCGGDADDRPTEEVAFYYNKIE